MALCLNHSVVTTMESFSTCYKKIVCSNPSLLRGQPQSVDIQLKKLWIMLTQFVYVD